MLVTLTDAQFEELQTLLASLEATKSYNGAETGEITLGSIKVEWSANQVKFTLS